MTTKRILGIAGSGTAVLCSLGFLVVGEPRTALWAASAGMWAGLFAWEARP